MASCTTVVTRTWPILPRKKASGGIGVPRNSLRLPVSRSTDRLIAIDWKLDCITPLATIPVR